MVLEYIPVLKYFDFHEYSIIKKHRNFIHDVECSWAARDGRSTYFIRLLQEFIRVLDVKGARIVVDTELRDYLSRWGKENVEEER